MFTRKSNQIFLFYSWTLCTLCFCWMLVWSFSLCFKINTNLALLWYDWSSLNPACTEKKPLRLHFIMWNNYMFAGFSECVCFHNNWGCWSKETSLLMTSLGDSCAHLDSSSSFFFPIQVLISRLLWPYSPLRWCDPTWHSVLSPGSLNGS